MDIFLVIIGSILFLICGWFALSTHTVVKSQSNWDEVYKALEEKGMSVPEEEAYRVMQKLNFWFSFAAFLGLLLLIGGILLIIF